jgi:hypothetical protein
VAGALAVGDEEDEDEEQAAKAGIKPTATNTSALFGPRPFAVQIEAIARSRGARGPDPCIPMARLYQSQCAILKTKRAAACHGHWQSLTQPRRERPVMP